MISPAIIMTVCLLQDGVPSTTCKDVSIAVEQALPPEQCAGKAGQAVMAQWIGDNPQWWVTRWKCVAGDKQEQDI